MKTLRIAMIADHADKGSKVDGGVQAVTKYLVEALSGFPDIDLHVITFRDGAAAKTTPDSAGYMRHILPAGKFGALTAYRQSQVTLNRFLQNLQPDIVHAQGVGHDGIVTARCNFPSVQTIHGILQEEVQHFAHIRRRLRHQLQSRLSKHYCIGGARHTILISPYVEEYWGDSLSGKRYLIPNPVAPGFYEIDRSEQPGRILYAGKVRQLKGVVDLIHALPSLVNVAGSKLVLAGALDEPEYVAMLESEVSRLGLGNVVEFVGILGEKELFTELARAAVLVLPSYQESAPMVIQEAMSAGIPIIATRVGGTRYQVRDGATGYLVEPGDVASISRRLNDLLSDDVRRRNFGEAAKSFAVREYGAESVARKTINVYEQVLGG